MKLPLTRDAHYYSQFMSPSQSKALFEFLMDNYDLSEPEVIDFPDGSQKQILPWRMIFLDTQLAESGGFALHHGRQATSFELLEQLRQEIVKLTGCELAVAVCLYYPDGEESLGFHSDLPAFGSTDVIASISLGAQREFLIRSQTNHDEQHHVTLESGSLLVMGKGFQDIYEHALAKGDSTTGPRFNISFRRFGNSKI
ncbi:hypothetical protein PSECIP111951_00928 [Pseudoalteromonas holothuriae]|uniref:Fe2OG dioxygenase domain-containing protein n=1 Tax=Pseudoalteromonas holothuriae TaxID=2963714 RepID=A0A9W4QVX9_9GAMM|nr:MULTISPECIES: alpha-ketoglutarate-dependent dioxygenase AlkB [unclassified Pseudoalteromonas]CAH9053956.1 hypothetical protein PSECIP111951_00928 [Pseudoalteromonas sp. CIP111951]CAH9055667.1 hypothetical protein PSECIP111854_01624 [Pseudoalteromonas sp. CIP111854]